MTSTQAENEQATRLITRKYKNLFRIGAAFNFLISTAMFVPQISFPILGISPIPDTSIYLHLAAGVVGLFGYGYFLASKNFPTNSNLIEFGIAGKVGVNFFAGLHVYLGTISRQIFLVTAWDILFTILFTRAVLDLNSMESKVR